MELTLDTPAQTLFQELDYREANGIEVSLLWNPGDNSISVYVCDAHTNDSFEVAVAGTDARQVFEHPYAYARRRPSPMRATQRDRHVSIVTPGEEPV